MEDDEAGNKWYEITLPVKKFSLKQQIRGGGTLEDISNVVEEAKSLYARKCMQHKGKSNSDKKWLEQMTKEGTAHDRVAAISSQLRKASEVPYKLHLLSDLVNMAGRMGHTSRIAIDALIELFTTSVMPPDRKLKAITTRSPKEISDHQHEREKILFYWHVEDQIKAIFAKFLTTLKDGTSSTVENVKGYCIKAIYLLLTKIPEEEKQLLSILSNKLGDVSPKMATRAVHYLLLLVKENPTMRGIVVRELEQFSFRKNNTLKAQYYSVNVLSQIMLSRADHELPQKLLEIYFSLFSKAAADANLDNRLVNSLLTGIRRAFPFSRHEATNMERFYTPLFSIAAMSAFPHRVAALMIVHQVIEKGEKQLIPRFYNSLYHLIMSSPVNTQNMTSSKLALFFSLVYKAIKMDDDVTRVLAFIQRMLQVCLQHKPSYVCGALFLISEVRKLFPEIDPHFTRDGPFVSPVVPVKAVPVAKPEAVPAEESDSDDNIAGFGTVAGKKKTIKKTKIPVRLSTVYVSGGNDIYDPNARNPCAAMAETECIWIIDQLTKHYHPSVVTFATYVREGGSIAYEGDPLVDFTLQAFLDAFSFKNPKKKHIASIRDGLDTALKRVSNKRETLTHDASAFTDLPASKVDIQDAFYYKYFVGRKNKILELAKQNESELLADEDAGPEEIDYEQADTTADEFDKKYLKYSYDSMTNDANVLADMRQDAMGTTDEGIDAELLKRDIEQGHDDMMGIHISNDDIPEDENTDGSTDDDGDAIYDEPNFKAAVEAGAESDDDDDDDDDIDMDEMDANISGRNFAKAVPALESEDTDDEDYDTDTDSQPDDEDSESGVDDDSSLDDELEQRKKRPKTEPLKSFDITRGSATSAGEASARELESMIDFTSKIGTSKFDTWLDKQENKGRGGSNGGRKGGGKGGKGGKGRKGGKRGGKRR
eukprot:TRINITY_DN3419_c0_g3_i2.p1 TRINITY_DN3419_c0_g3~~TRINITY_DN3419_c0_g3_i2.p1  ORF type:complete len:935 (+),score=197.98 TRINITY_DN3419_c0_g3_i2:43-2847(+)